MADGCFPFVNATIRRIKCISCKVKRFGYERATFVSVFEVFETDNRCTWLALNSRLDLLRLQVCTAVPGLKTDFGEGEEKADF